MTALALVAAPAFASDPHSEATSIGQAQNQGQSQAQSQGQSQLAVGAASSSSGAVNSTKSSNVNLNKTSSAAGAGAEASSDQSQSADNNGNSYEGDDNKTEVYAVSYTDTQPQAPQAAIGSSVVVTTWGVKVLGPVFGMTDQHVHYLPAAIGESADLAVKATTNDGTYAGEQKQFAYIAAVCAHDVALAEQLNFGCK